METIWSQTKQLLEKTLSPGLFNLWIKPLAARARDGALELVAPNAFVAAWVRERLSDSIAEAAAVVMGARPQVFVVEATQAAAPVAASAAPRTSPASMRLRRSADSPCPRRSAGD